MLAAAHRHVLRMEQGYSQELTRRERELERREADMARREGDLQKRSSALTREERAIYRKDRERLRSKLLLVVHKELGHTMHMSEAEEGALADSRIVDAVMAEV
jgi:hypothetical protein